MWGLQNEFTYVGANIPSAGTYISQLIQVDNPAVPGGRSLLRWTGALWAPPPGEPISCKTRLDSPLATVTPGTTVLTQILKGDVIPDYMVPEGIGIELEIWATFFDASSAVSATFFAILGSSTSTTVSRNEYPVSWVVTNTVGTAKYGDGFRRVGTQFKKSGYWKIRNMLDQFSTSVAGVRSSHVYADGDNAIRVYAVPGSTTQTFEVFEIRAVSKGVV